MAGIFLTRAPSRSPVVKFFGIDIPAGNTVVVDTIPFTDHISAKWVVTITDPTTTEVQSYIVLGTHLSGAASSPSHNKYSQIGNIIKNVADVTVSGSNLQLEITNNETHDIVADVLRVDLVA